MKNLYRYLCLLYALALLSSAVWAQEDSGEENISAELNTYYGELYSSRPTYEDRAEAALGEEDNPNYENTPKGKAETKMKEEVALAEDTATSKFASSQGMSEAEAKDFAANAQQKAEAQVGQEEARYKPLKDTSKSLVGVEDTALDGLAYAVVDYNVDDPVSEFILDYQVDEIERLLDQKLDLQSGFMATDITTLDVDATYGFSLEEWEDKVVAAGSSTGTVSDYSADGYTPSDGLVKMSAIEAHNLTLIGEGVAAKEENISGLIEETSIIEEDGGIELRIDHLDEEVAERLLNIDLKIIKILSKDAYDQEDEEYGDSLVHPITNVVLKGYSRRKALKEMNGGKYAQAEDMRKRNKEGIVIDESEIIDLMQSLYPGYVPAEY